MTNKIIYAVLGVLAVVVIVLGVNYFSQSPVFSAASNRGINFFDALNMKQGFFAGTNAQLKVSNTGALTIGTNGTAISNRQCATATWNPGSLGTSTLLAAVTSTDIVLSGAVMGDTCVASLTSATTSAAKIGCDVTGTATGTIFLTNVSNAALDLATGTAQVCYTH